MLSRLFLQAFSKLTLVEPKLCLDFAYVGNEIVEFVKVIPMSLRVKIVPNVSIPVSLILRLS